MRRIHRTTLAAVLLAGSSLAATAQTLTVATGGAVTSLDPHFYNATPNNSISLHFFDRLVVRDEKSRPQPGLALSWEPVADTTWEFKLRPGVKWHDGRDFTAEDVAFTIKRVPEVPNSPGGFVGFVRMIERVEIVDPLTVRFHTRGPYPLLPIDMASFGIVSKHVGEGAATEDYNSGKVAIGTGPYRLVSYRPNDRTEMVRNDEWWGPKQPWEKVSYRFIGTDGARTAAVLAGDVDLIDQVSAADLPRLRREANISLSETQGLRLIYINFDASRRENLPFVTDNNGKPLPKNPFDDIRVRRALNIAIHREALAERVMEGTAQPAGQWMPPGTFGHNPDVKPPAYDPNGAKKLLAEAGFPQGFKVTLHSPNDRYPNDAKAAQAVAQMWSRIGVQTQVEALPWASFSPRSARQDFAARLSGWASTNGDGTATLVNILGTYDRARSTGANNSGRYSNPELDALRDRSMATLDPEKREELLREAVKMAMDDVALVPLFMLTNVWAMRKGIDYVARMDEGTLAMSTRPAR